MVGIFFMLLFSVVSGWFITEPLRVPNFQMTGGMIVLGFMFGFFIILGQWALYKTLYKAPRLFKAELVIFIIYLVVISFLGRANIGLEKDATSICNGTGNPNAAAYPTGQGLHPIVISYQSTGRSIKTGDYPAKWLPKNLNSLQLVACINEVWMPVETCSYEANDSIERQQDSMDVIIYSAQTHKEIETFRLLGGYPAVCQQVESFSNSGESDTRQGTAISSQQITNRLTHLVLYP